MVSFKEINIANVLVNKRKEKGITQDELANYIGVSKAPRDEKTIKQSMVGAAINGVLMILPTLEAKPKLSAI